MSSRSIPNKVLSLGVMSNNYNYEMDDEPSFSGSHYVAPSKQMTMGANSPSYQEKLLAQSRFRAKLENDQTKEPSSSRRPYVRKEYDEPDVGLPIGKDISKEEEHRNKRASQDAYRAMIAEAQARPAPSNDRQPIQRRQLSGNDENTWMIGRSEDPRENAYRQDEFNARVRGDMMDKEDRLRRLAAAEKETFTGLLIGRQESIDRKNKKSFASNESNIFYADVPQESFRETNRARMEEVEKNVNNSGLVLKHAKAPTKDLPPFVYAEERHRSTPEGRTGSLQRQPYDNNKPFIIGSENAPASGSRSVRNKQTEYREALSRDIARKDSMRAQNDAMYARREL